MNKYEKFNQWFLCSSVTPFNDDIACFFDRQYIHPMDANRRYIITLNEYKPSRSNGYRVDIVDKNDGFIVSKTFLFKDYLKFEPKNEFRRLCMESNPHHPMCRFDPDVVELGHPFYTFEFGDPATEDSIIYMRRRIADFINAFE